MSAIDTELKARLAILLGASGDVRMLRAAIKAHGSGLGAIEAPSLRARLRAEVHKPNMPGRVEEELELADQAGARWRLPGDDGFPPALRNTDCALLCVRGVFPPAPAVGIVGSRKADDYGTSIAAALARALVGVGVTVVSGGAVGVDQAAHDAAIRGGGRTVAILGTGVGARMSAARRAVHDELAAHGAVASELLTRADGARWTFTDRNRLIPRLSRAVVITQAAHRSGTLNTARHAREAGVPIFAVPGDVCYDLSAGPNGLIAAGQARLLSHPGDLADLLGADALHRAAWPSGRRGGRAPKAGEGLPIDADPSARVLDLLHGAGGLSYDELQGQVQLPAGLSLAEVLIDLELKGQVRREGGNRFVPSV